VARWSWGLLGATSRVLLDRQAPEPVLEAVQAAVEGLSARVADLHVWEIGPGYRAAIVAVESERLLAPAEIAAAIPPELGIAHLSLEVHATKGESTHDRPGSPA
jgi:Co/Zn/Cd efflux system component